MVAAAVANSGSSTKARLSFLRSIAGLCGRNEVCDDNDMGFETVELARDDLTDFNCDLGGER
jgi:hypothetical protein